MLWELLPLAPKLTTGELIDAIAKLAIALDPEWVRRRYERALKGRRVVGKRNPDGTATLTGHDLPFDEVAAACARLDALAHAAKTAGHPDRLDHLRADLLVGLITGRYTAMTDQQILAALLTEAEHRTANPNHTNRTDDDAKTATTTAKTTTATATRTPAMVTVTAGATARAMTTSTSSGTAKAATGSTTSTGQTTRTATRQTTRAAPTPTLRSALIPPTTAPTTTVAMTTLPMMAPMTTAPTTPTTVRTTSAQPPTAAQQDLHRQAPAGDRPGQDGPGEERDDAAPADGSGGADRDGSDGEPPGLSQPWPGAAGWAAIIARTAHGDGW